jgi:hypothetical protein
VSSVPGVALCHHTKSWRKENIICSDSGAGL